MGASRIAAFRACSMSCLYQEQREGIDGSGQLSVADEGELGILEAWGPVAQLTSCQLSLLL